jgi:DUF971 family protein
MATPITPLEIRRAGSHGLTIAWSDGNTQELSSEVLRRNCPCAGCREARGDESHAKPLTGERASGKKRSLAIVQNTLQEELDLSTIWGVGQYALGIRWGDGHDSGIYTFEYLKSLMPD